MSKKQQAGAGGRRGMEEREARVQGKALELYPTHSGRHGGLILFKHKSQLTSHAPVRNDQRMRSTTQRKGMVVFWTAPV